VPPTAPRRRRHDTLNPASSKNPKNRKAAGIDNTLELFKTQAVHGGLWRCAYKVDSIGVPSALIYFAGLAAPYMLALATAGLAIAGATNLYSNPP
jgi:hypothetical protein